MTRTALQGLAEVGDIESFRPAWWFEPFDVDLSQLLRSEGFQTLLKYVRPPVSCSWVASNKPFPLAADEPAGDMLVTPMARSGLAILTKRKDGNASIQSMWPFTTDGIQHEVEIERIVIAPNRLEAMIVGTLPCGLEVTWHDVLFAADRAFYAVGSVHEILLAGFAHELRPAPDAPIVVPAVTEQWASVRASFPESFDSDGNLTIQTKGMSALLPCDRISPEFCEVRGPVKKIERYAGELFGRTTDVVTVAVHQGNGPDVDLAVFVTDHVRGEASLPGIGDDFAALVRLVGRLWQPNVRRTAG